MTGGHDEKSQRVYPTPGSGLSIAWASLRKSISASVTEICIALFLGATHRQDVCAARSA